jgi:hypothetical protein
MNRKWHEAHPMPANASREQRIRWHRAHARHCGCRPIPESLRADVRKPGGKIQERTFR